MKKYKIGMVQVNNSFSGQNYLPLSLGFLVSYAEFHCKNYNDFEFLNPIYKRVPIKEAVELYKDCDIVAFSVYVWNNNISMRIAKALKEVNPNILTLAGGCHIPERPEYIEKYMNDHPYITLLRLLLEFFYILDLRTQNHYNFYSEIQHKIRENLEIMANSSGQKNYCSLAPYLFLFFVSFFNPILYKYKI